MTTAPFIPGNPEGFNEYPTYPYWHLGKVIAHQDPLPLEAHEPLPSTDPLAEPTTDQS